jgi:uncharacterized protein
MCYDAAIDFLHSLLPSMPRLTEEIRKYIGMETDLQFACDPVERGAVRRYAQAIMDPDPIYMWDEAVRGTRYAKPVAAATA